MFTAFFSRLKRNKAQIRAARAARMRLLGAPQRPYEHRDTDCI